MEGRINGGRKRRQKVEGDKNWKEKKSKRIIFQIVKKTLNNSIGVNNERKSKNIEPCA